MISAKDKEQFLAQAGKKKLELEEKILELRELTKPIPPENAIGRVSRMDAINNRSINEAALRQAEESLKKLNYSMDKVDEEWFGSCVSCGNPIPIGRLLLIPESNRCVRCAR